MTDQPTNTSHSQREDFLKQLQKEIIDPIHKRLIQAYTGNNPLQSMEDEFSKVLKEVLTRED